MAAPDYSLPEQWLHRLALGSPSIGRALFSLEQRYSARQEAPTLEQPVFISGLARAGSTVLLNLLFESGRFRSLTYRDMPFVLATGWWKSVRGRDKGGKQSKERAHGDTLLVDYDSPEAFEEVFWRIFCGKDYIRDDALQPHIVPTEQLVKFRQFVRQVLKSGDRPAQARYLSKNNNNVLRLPALKRAFKDSIILVPFRDPLSQAASLLRQHNRFCQLQADDRFGLSYMRWLGHYEFGLGHKPMVFGGTPPDAPRESLDYWLSLWLDCYSYLMDSAPEGVIFLCHEHVCHKPREVFAALAPRLDFQPDSELVSRVYRPVSAESGESKFDSSVHRQCQSLYDAMLLRAGRDVVI